ncbi:MAG: response regulator [Planctomycetota bacterium]
MTKILVVDDSAVDRHLVCSILSAVDGWEVESASDGARALEISRESEPDLIVTDLQMPYVDGLQLVKELQAVNSRIPVVLVTSQGSEQTAIEALKFGAASYSPKNMLQKDLVRTVRQVLEISHHVRASQLDAIELVSTNLAFVLENDVGLIGPLIEHLQSQMPVWSERDRLQIAMAIDEALVNAMHHGNLEVDSQLRDDDDAQYYDQIRERRVKTPYSDRRVQVQAEFSEQHLCVQISDEGPGFDPCSIPDPTCDENIQKVGGRGLFLIKSFMNQVAHNAAGNQITMTKFKDQL